MKTACWGLLLWAVLVSATYAQGIAGQPIYTLKVCNRSSHNVVVATNYIAVGDQHPEGARWTYHGWTHIPKGDCSDVLATQYNKYWARAEVEGDLLTYWGEDGNQCVEYSDSYTFYDDGQQSNCTEGVPATFKHFVIEGRAYHYEWDLN